MYVQVSKFNPIQISPNAFLTSNGVQDEDGRRFSIYTPSDVKRLLGVLQTHIVAAVGGLLPMKDVRGRLPFEFVNENLFWYVQTTDGESAHKFIVAVAPYLIVARNLVEHSTQDDDQRALCVFTDLFLDAALGMSKADILEARGQAKVSIESLLDDDASLYQRWKSPITELPWPGDLGANIARLDDFSTAHALFGVSDLEIIGNKVAASMGPPSAPIPMELKLSDVGTATLRDFLIRSRTESHLDEGVEIGDSVGGKCSMETNARNLAALHQKTRYRIFTYPTNTGERYWSLRRIPVL